MFQDDADRRAFLASIALAVRAAEWQCHAYCLMGNHFHLLLRAGERGLGPGMHIVNTRCAQRYNRRYGVTGHVFDGRFANTPIETEQHRYSVARYIHLNPVRAGLCAHPADWRWSSFRAIAGLERAPRFVSPEPILDLFGGGADGALAGHAFARFVQDGIADDEPGNPHAAAKPPLGELIRTGLEGGRVAHIRYGYTQREVAAALGVAHITFRRYLAR